MKFIFPADGEWLIFWGGDNPEENRHAHVEPQKYAIDAVILKDNVRHRGKGLRNEDYFCYKKPLLACADGEVVEVIDGAPDNQPLQINDFSVFGNYIVIKHNSALFSLLAHITPGSIVVKPGQKVKSGQKIGLVGNSGNSTEPHIHFHLMTSNIYAEYQLPKYDLKRVSRSVELSFSEMIINGGKVMNYKPKKNDLLQNPPAKT